MELYDKPSPFSFLVHYGVKGMKWGVRRTQEELARARGVANTPESDTMGVEIHKSLGAKAKNYEILDPASGERFHFSEGTKIKDPKVFAGKDGAKKLEPETMVGLAEQVGGDPSEWQHCKGIGTIDYYGEDREAEVHWFQEKTIGKVKFKVKKWLD